MVKDSVEIMEQGACSGMAAVPIHYYDVDRMQEKTIESCQGDLTVICNVLADYADMLDELLQTDRERLGFCGALQYERMRDRCRKITADLQEKTGYDRAAAIDEYYPPWEPPVSRFRATRKWYFPPSEPPQHIVAAHIFDFTINLLIVILGELLMQYHQIIYREVFLCLRRQKSEVFWNFWEKI